ncbi:MAG: hypothetical protein V4819_07595 [Verrucomicrobiota bacterium]
MAVFLITVVLLSQCNRPGEQSKGPSNDTGNEVSKSAPIAKSEVKPPPPLPATALDGILNGCVLIASPGKPYQQGVLIDGDSQSSGSSKYLIVCAAILGKDAIVFARRHQGTVRISTAKKAVDLPSGLSVYSFFAGPGLPSLKPGVAGSGDTLHALRLAGEGSVSEEERLSTTEKIRGLEEQITQSREAREAQMEMMRDPSRRGTRPPDPRLSSMDEGRWMSQLSQLKSTLEMPVKTISISEPGTGKVIGELEAGGAALDNTILVSSALTALAIRHQGKWLDLHEALAAPPTDLEQVTLEISGYSNSVSLNCKLAEKLPFRQPAYSFVAATTFELEQLSGGSLAERLAKVDPMRFPQQGTARSISKRLTWNGRPTTLWIKLFRDDQPEKLLLDEMILLDDADGFTARWGKPPSPLVHIPTSEPDFPADLVESRSTVEMGATIRDMVAAGDGSVLMIQTDQAPYWTPLDLKTGLLAAPPWKATADTLLAAQAGRVYLIDRKSGVVEIWDLESRKRTGLQVLADKGEIISVAAPLKAAGQPILIVTDGDAVFVDSVDFEVIPVGLDLRSCLGGERVQDNRLPQLDPGSTWARASGDGTLYSLSGTRAGSGEQSLAMISITVDRNGIAEALNTSPQVLSIRGRFQNEEFPDHGGGDLHVVAKGGSNKFPGFSGTISLLENIGKRPFAQLNDPPLVPSGPTKLGSALRPDRKIHLDSSLGVMVLPDAGKLHLLRLKLPPAPQAAPGFVFTGEEVGIPLPRGTGHKLVSEVGGKTSIENSILKWTVPPSDHRGRITQKLEWTGELGSPLSRVIEFPVVRQSRLPTVESPDGKKVVSMKLKGVIPSNRVIVGLAGCGQVLLTKSSSTLDAWNLATSELLFSTGERAEMFFGDADHLYLFDRKGVLKSNDISTGNLLKEVMIGSGEYGEHDSTGLIWINAGHASRLPLIAVEKNGFNYKLLNIDRNTLAATTIPTPQEGQERLGNWRFFINPSGATAVALSHVVFRNPRAAAVRYFPGIHLNGDPDESGRFVVASQQIIDFGVVPPRTTRISTLPGVGDSSAGTPDCSGRYLLVSDYDEKTNMLAISVRTMHAPGRELCKLRMPSEHRNHLPWVISGSRLLAQPTPFGICVYDFDIPRIVEGLSR